MTESSNRPLFGLWQPRPLQALYYGPDCVKNHLLSCLPSKTSKAFILTGSSLANKTSLIKDVESLLGDRHAATFSSIKQHAPVAELDKATELVLNDDSIDTIISVGGGSPIDSGKAISYRAHEKGGKWLHHITIPTTLSAAECTHMAGYTNEDGVKTGIGAKEVAVNAIFYDPKFGAETPAKLWLGTGCRALDHAIETLYNPTATEIAKVACLQAASSLFKLLPEAKQSHGKDDDLTTKLFLAAYSSLGFIGLNMKGGLGLSHALGYALGSPYQIPHGETSALSLGHVVKLKAQTDKQAAEQIARLAPFLGIESSGDATKVALAVGDRVLDLVKELGFTETLTDRKIGKDQVDIITQRATQQKEGKMYDAVKQLVENLY